MSSASENLHEQPHQLSRQPWVNAEHSYLQPIDLDSLDKTDVLLMAVGQDKRARRHLIQNIIQIIQKGKRLGTVSLRVEKGKI